MSGPAQILYCGDGIAGLRALEPGSVDLVITDPPWGATRAKWDRPLKWSAWWEAIDRALKPNGIAAVFSSLRLALTIVPLATRRFAYDLVWSKNKASGHLNATRAPLRAHETILIFGDSARGGSAYVPQFTYGHAPMHAATRRSKSELYGRETVTKTKAGTTDRLATSVLPFDVVDNDADIRIHPTQKPIPLLRWLVRAYSMPGDLIADPTCGAGGVLHACRTERRAGVAWEIDPVIADRAQRWLDGRDLPLFERSAEGA